LILYTAVHFAINFRKKVTLLTLVVIPVEVLEIQLSAHNQDAGQYTRLKDMFIFAVALMIFATLEVLHPNQH